MKTLSRSISAAILLGFLVCFWACPHASDALEHWGFQRSLANDPMKAIALYNLALLLNPNNPAALVNRASANRQIGQNHQALNDYSNAIRNGKAIKSASAETVETFLSGAYLGRARVRQTLLDDAGAIDDFTKLLEMKSCLGTSRADTLFFRGLSFERTTDYTRALADYAECLRWDPYHVGAHFNRGRIHAECNPHVDLNLATEDFCCVINDCVMSNHSYGMAGAHYYLGSIHKKLGAKRIALAYLDDAIRLNPTCAPAYHLRGNVLAEMGASKPALSDYDRCVALSPNYSDIYHDRGLLKSRLGDRSAINDLSRAVALNPNDFSNYAARGYEWWDRMKYSLALADFEKALKLNPTDVPSLMGRSAMRCRRGDHKGSQADLRLILKLDPSQRDVIDAVLDKN